MTLKLAPFYRYKREPIELGVASLATTDGSAPTCSLDNCHSLPLAIVDQQEAGEHGISCLDRALIDDQQEAGAHGISLATVACSAGSG
jgi:hypothetical protein